MRPKEGEFKSHYTDLVQQNNLTDAFEQENKILESFLRAVPEDKSEYRYAPGKWSVKEVLQHCMDAERVFAYRALCIARKEKVSLPSFEENDYAEYSEADRRDLQSLVDEFLVVRKSTELLFASFTDQMLLTVGIANDNPVSPLSLGYSLIGHGIHHINILQARYGL